MSSAWQIHLTKFRSAHPQISLKEAMREASKTYRGAPAAKKAYRSAQKGNPWLAHVQAYRAAHPNVTYSEALKGASKTFVSRTYRSGNSNIDVDDEIEKIYNRFTTIPFTRLYELVLLLNKVGGPVTLFPTLQHRLKTTIKDISDWMINSDDLVRDFLIDSRHVSNGKMDGKQWYAMYKDPISSQLFATMKKI